MDYSYVAYSEGGEIVRGKLTAASESAAIELLSYVGYQAVSLRPFRPFVSIDRLSEILFPPKPNEIILFYQQLATLLESGISIVAALELLQRQANNRTLKRVLGDIISDLRSGYQLSAALSKHPKLFPAVHNRLVSIGEQGGNIARIAALLAGIPQEASACTVNQYCNAGLKAINFATRALKCGDGEIILCAGVELMSHYGMGSDIQIGFQAKYPVRFTSRIQETGMTVPQGLCAEIISENEGHTREDLDKGLEIFAKVGRELGVIS